MRSCSLRVIFLLSPRHAAGLPGAFKAESCFVKIVSIPLIVFLFPSDAFAYIDPGSGMLVWQGVIAAIGAGVIFAKNPVQTIKGWVRRLKRK